MSVSRGTAEPPHRASVISPAFRSTPVMMINSSILSTVRGRPVARRSGKTLLAWYLVELARSRGAAVDPAALPVDFEAAAKEEFGKYGGQGKLDLGRTKAILAEPYRRERA